MSPTYYEITVRVHLDSAHWRRWFDGMRITLHGDGTTTLSGPVVDQAALHGLLNRIRDLGLVLLFLHSRED